jgi:hypothetical protein
MMTDTEIVEIPDIKTIESGEDIELGEYGSSDNGADFYIRQRATVQRPTAPSAYLERRISDDKALQNYLQSVHDSVGAHFSNIGLRHQEQLYYNMIPARTTCSLPSGQMVIQDIFWIDITHPFWLALLGTFGEDVCVVRIPMPTTGGVAPTEILAIKKEAMDQIVENTWKSLYTAGLTHRLNLTT